MLGSEGKIRQKSSFEKFEVLLYLKNTIKVNYNEYLKNFNSNQSILTLFAHKLVILQYFPPNVSFLLQSQK